jgi:signal transduction histidine kinase
VNNRAAIYGLLIGGLLMAALTTGIAFSIIQKQEENSYSDARPNLAELVYQIHSNIHDTKAAISTYQSGVEGGVDFSEVELAFDILWSQAFNIQGGAIGSSFLQLPGVPPYLRNLRVGIVRIESLLPELEQRQTEAYEQVQESLNQFGAALNPLHLAAALESEANRDTATSELLSTFIWIFALLFALVLIGAAAGVLIARDRIFQSRMQATLRRRVRARTKELAMRNTELEETNARLRQFVNAASHDLQEPLRKIKLFSNDLAKQIGLELTDEQDMAVVAISDSANRLQSSLQNLLTLGRVSHRPLDYESLDLEEVIADTLGYLEDIIDTSGAKITVGRMPTINADNVQMRQLFRHLIGNALKFRAPDRDCRVEISYKRPTSSTAGQIEITDNGVGFPSEQGARIFEPFRQLHSRTRYDGAGLGLAITARIADTHGWRVTASGAPDEGATFTIYLAEDTVQNSRDIKAA